MRSDAGVDRYDGVAGWQRRAGAQRMRRTHRPGIWTSVCLTVWVSCGDDTVTPPPDPAPPAQVVAVKPSSRARQGSFDWGTEVHVTFDRDPGRVRLDHGNGPRGRDLVGSGTLRAFLVLTRPISLVWGDGESYDVGVERVPADESGPVPIGVAPDIEGLVVNADDLNAVDITVSFTEPISPPGDDDPNRML